MTFCNYKSAKPSAERFDFFGEESHECPVDGCYRAIPVKNSVCGGHWHHLPASVKEALEHWQPCLDDPAFRADPCDEYVELIEQAKKFWKERNERRGFPYSPLVTQVPPTQWPVRKPKSPTGGLASFEREYLFG